jgi:translation initiation factor IF-1
MSKEDLISVQGTVTAVTGGGNFKVKCDTGHEVLARLSGRMKRMRIRVIEGDYVTVGLSPYDLDRGLITHRAR